MIKWMIITMEEDYADGKMYPAIAVRDLSNIQTAEAERTMYLEDNPSVSPENVSVVQYRE